MIKLTEGFEKQIKLAIEELRAHEALDAVEIPGRSGYMLIRSGTRAALEKEAEKGVIVSDYGEGGDRYLISRK